MANTPNWEWALNITTPANGRFTLNYRMSPTLRKNGLFLYRSKTDLEPEQVTIHGGGHDPETGTYTFANTANAALTWYLVNWEMIAGDPVNVPFPNLGHQSPFWGNPQSGGIFYSINVGGAGSGVGGGCPDVTAAAFYVN